MSATFYLDRDGQPDGPFTLGQLKSMWSSGAIKADSLIAEAGADQWRPVTELSAELEAPSPVAVVKQDAFAPLHTPIQGKLPGRLTLLGKIGLVVGLLSAPFVLPTGAGVPGVLLGVVAFLWCRTEKKAAPITLSQVALLGIALVALAAMGWAGWQLMLK